MMLGTVSETALTWASVRVDRDRHPDHLGPVVVGAGEGGRDRDEAERRALERAGQVHPAGDVERVAAGPGGDVGGPDLARGRAARRRLLGPARAARRRPAIAASGQYVIPRSEPVRPGRHLEAEIAEELVAVVAVELEAEGRVGARDRAGRAGREPRREGPRLARALRLPFGPESMLKFDLAVCVGELRVPGEEATGRSRRACSSSASPPDLGRRRTGGYRRRRTGPRAGLRSRPSPGRSAGPGRKLPTSFALIPKPEATMNSRYWSPGFGWPM